MFEHEIVILYHTDRGFDTHAPGSLPFARMLGSSARALTGLMFVVITLIAGSRMRRSSEPTAAFSTPNVVHFGAALLVAAILCAPWQALWNASLLLGLCGLWGMTYIAKVARRARRQTDYTRCSPTGCGIRFFRWSPIPPSSSRRCCSQALLHWRCSSPVPLRFCSCSSVSTTPGITLPTLSSSYPSRRTRARTNIVLPQLR
jgi:hypothetical protein